MYQNSEYRVRPVMGSNDAGFLYKKQQQKDKSNRPSLNMNYNNNNNKVDLHHNRDTSTLYQSLPQPFVNKKQLVSFDQSLNYFKSR